MKAGDQTPWGRADYVDDIAPGIWIVGTPSHGGVKLSPALNKAVPLAMRRLDGWYEEDCDANIAIVCYPTEWRKWWFAMADSDGYPVHPPDDDIVAKAWEALTRWNVPELDAFMQAHMAS